MKPRTINICLLAAGAWAGCLMLDYGVGTRMHKPIVSLTDGKNLIVGGGSETGPAIPSGTTFIGTLEPINQVGSPGGTSNNVFYSSSNSFVPVVSSAASNVTFSNVNIDGSWSNISASTPQATLDSLPVGRLLVRRLEGGSSAPVEVWHPTATAIVCKGGASVYAPLKFPMDKNPCGE